MNDRSLCLEEGLRKISERLTKSKYTCPNCKNTERFFVTPIVPIENINGEFKHQSYFYFEILCSRCWEHLDCYSAEENKFDSIPRISVTTDEDSGDYGNL